jgi:hypothetical protein
LIAGQTPFVPRDKRERLHPLAARARQLFRPDDGGFHGTRVGKIGHAVRGRHQQIGGGQFGLGRPMLRLELLTGMRKYASLAPDADSAKPQKAARAVSRSAGSTLRHAATPQWRRSSLGLEGLAAALEQMAAGQGETRAESLAYLPQHVLIPGPA